MPIKPLRFFPNSRGQRAVANRLAFLACLAAGIVNCQPCSATDRDTALLQTAAPAIEEHCTSCHGADPQDIAGEVDLQKFLDSVGTAEFNDRKNTELISRVIKVLDLNEMPPADERQPSPKTRQRLIRELKTVLRDLVSEQSSFSVTPIRRMNRFQYNNAVTDLFDLNCTVFTLPERALRNHRNSFRPETGKMPDVVAAGNRPLGKSQMIEPRLSGVAAFPQDLRAEHGFDNQADHLSLSPLLMEAFLKLGQSVTQSPDFQKKNVGIWKSFFESPADEADLAETVKKRLAPFLTRAFRRKVDGNLVGRYARFVIRQMDAGADFETAMKSVAAATISSPKFLYLYDGTNSAAAAEQPENDYVLASRLSFFLWGSVPDEELLELAAKGELKQPAILEQQIDRMLVDRKIKRFCDSFPSQWLQLDRIISSIPNRQKFPGFYYSKYRNSMHMMLEPLLIFETVLIENLPVTQFIDSDFTYRTARLELAYAELKSPPPESDNKKKRRNTGEVGVLNYFRVPVTDRRVGGLITNAAVMTMTSGPERTQPITRGAWVATVIFNNPPEPPPANVPALGEKPAAGEEHLTLRERLAMHRKRADCKGCHEQIDPLGFALENYSAIGTWRDKYENGRDIDMAGRLLKKHEFGDVIKFKDALLLEKDRFARGLAGHLLSFALARRLDAADQIALDEIVTNTVADEYRFKALLKHVILSKPFLTTGGAPDRLSDTSAKLSATNKE